MTVVDDWPSRVKTALRKGSIAKPPDWLRGKEGITAKRSDDLNLLRNGRSGRLDQRAI
jgi:hypothetical protein